MEFPDGLSVITGPTGAGKSILIGALGLLLGRKADAGVIAQGASNCVVEGEFESKDPSLEALCQENDLDWNGGSLIVRRVLSQTGRSRAFINDSPVALSLLEDFGSRLVDIHSQHDSLLLTRPRYQLSVLDAFCGNALLLEECEAAWTEVSSLDSRIRDLRAKITAAENENDYNAALFEALDKAGLREGEIAELEQEQYSLAHAEQVKALLSEAQELFEPSDSESRGLNSQISLLGRTLEKLSEFLPDFAGYAGRVESSRIELKDICEDILSRNADTEDSAARLEWVDERLAKLYDLLKRHACADEAELIARREALRGLVTGLDDVREQLSSLEKEQASARKHLQDVCKNLHDEREKGSAAFCEKVMEHLRFMEMDKTVFGIEFTPRDFSACGTDDISFVISQNGSRPSPVSKTASGGELSRIMLSLKAVMSGCMDMPTMIFDEIDTGVSGSVADHMGSVICGIGSSRQVFVITHLPQVAAKGRVHYLVSKAEASERSGSVTTIKKLSPEERVLELARMLSGSTLTPQAVENAKSLLLAD